MLVVVQLLLALAEFTMVTDPQLDLTTHYSCGFTCPNCFTVNNSLGSYVNGISNGSFGSTGTVYILHNNIQVLRAFVTKMVTMATLLVPPSHLQLVKSATILVTLHSHVLGNLLHASCCFWLFFTMSNLLLQKDDKDTNNTPYNPIPRIFFLLQIDQYQGWSIFRFTECMTKQVWRTFFTQIKLYDHAKWHVKESLRLLYAQTRWQVFNIFIFQSSISTLSLKISLVLSSSLIVNHQTNNEKSHLPNSKHYSKHTLSVK